MFRLNYKEIWYWVGVWQKKLQYCPLAFMLFISNEHFYNIESVYKKNYILKCCGLGPKHFPSKFGDTWFLRSINWIAFEGYMNRTCFMIFNFIVKLIFIKLKVVIKNHLKPRKNLIRNGDSQIILTNPYIFCLVLTKYRNDARRADSRNWRRCSGPFVWEPRLEWGWGWSSTASDWSILVCACVCL